MNKNTFLVFLMFSPLFWRGTGWEAFAQKLYPLHGNAAIIQYNKSTKQQINKSINGRNPRPPVDSLLHGLSLPFYDDFSYPGPYPNSTQWMDQYVFVNHTKAIAPITIGVATFDGLNQYGYPYDSTVVSSGGAITPAEASDTLTSHPIRLDSIPSLSQSLSPSDSVYLSFYYQSMGFWVEPASSGYDLELDFYSPKDSIWYNAIWSVAGYYPQDSSWHQVMIPITDSGYFGNNFQFRFRNKSCGCGDDDHWHIDAVYLKNNRNHSDTILNNVSFVYDLPSPLKNYTQMPYTQFTGAADMKNGIYATLRSNEYDTLNPGDSVAEFITTFYNIYNASGTPIRGYGASPPPNGSNNIWSYYHHGYCNDTLVRPSLGSFTYPTPLAFNDSFLVKFYYNNGSVSGGGYGLYPAGDDTTYFHQVFSNYFAYDDGSAEGAFGIESTNGPGNYQIASSFTLNKKDTLRSVDIFFDPVIDIGTIQSGSASFNLVIWGDNGGVPGTSIYTDTTTRYPYFAPNHSVPGIQRENMFNRYQLLQPLIIDSDQIFYVGINQINNYPAIPIGFDMNTDHHNNMFYNANVPVTSVCANTPCWFVFPGDEDPSYKGSLMIRPVFGDSLEALGIKKYNNTISANIMVYPNPATDQVFIQSDNTITKIVVTDLIGNLVIQQTANPIQSINTVSLQDGAYFIKAFTDKGLTDTKKLIISR